MAEERASSFSGPVDEGERAAWRAELVAWRAEARRKLGFDGSAYLKPEFRWVSSCYSCNMLMVWDETFLDSPHWPLSSRRKYLHEGLAQFGGYDAVVLWQAYPRIGFDERNQFDHYRDLPGGLDGVRDMVRRFRSHGVKGAFVDYNPWDRGTRREGVSDAEAIGSLVHSIEADGVFLDTLDRGSIDMRYAADRARSGVAFESEDALPLGEHRASTTFHWAQWFDPGDASTIMRNRWFEQRHMMHVIRRWDGDHTNELHMAWMNGAGMLVWENVFRILECLEPREPPNAALDGSRPTSFHPPLFGGSVDTACADSYGGTVCKRMEPRRDPSLDAGEPSRQTRQRHRGRSRNEGGREAL